MKLASLKEGGRDGTLVVVDKRLKRAVRVAEIAKTFQQAIENWQESAKKLLEVYAALNRDPNLPGCFDLDEGQLAAPLPRAFQWADGSAYVNHVELVRKARGAKMPENFWTDPLMYQGGSDGFLGPREEILIESIEWGIDFESEIAVITDDVPMGVSPPAASKHIKLLMLVNDVSLRNLIPGELAKGFGFFHGKPATAFSPAAVTPDELGHAWKDEKVHLPLITVLNGVRFGAPDAGEDMTFNFSRLISHAARSRFLGAGTIIGSGTISNLDRSKGSSCIAEKRMLEILAHGEPKTPFMQFGDRVRIEMLDKDGSNIFGTIDQEVKQYHPPGE
ncbi:MAG: fumarylacetoacetate hydrolase family protein [Candidatus Aminicenantes bacterium]|jgi:fumarylacetoacetate (FAA) hydrolase